MTATTLHAITPQDLLRLGGDSLAYITVESRHDQPLFVVHAADGTLLLEAPSRALAEAASVQHGLVPMSVH